MKPTAKQMQRVILVVKRGGIDVPRMELEHQVNIRLVKPYDSRYKYDSPEAKKLLQEVDAEKFLIV